MVGRVQMPRKYLSSWRALGEMVHKHTRGCKHSQFLSSFPLITLLQIFEKMAKCCVLPVTVKSWLHFCAAMWKCARGCTWPFIQPIQKILRIPMKNLNSNSPEIQRKLSWNPFWFECSHYQQKLMLIHVSMRQQPDCLSSCSSAALGNSSLVTGDQFVLQPLLQWLILPATSVPVSSCCTALCATAWPGSFPSCAGNRPQSWSPQKGSPASGLTEQCPVSGWKSNCFYKWCQFMCFLPCSV